MIYILRTFGRKNKTALKVGYAGNIKDRMKTYYHHNPYFEMIACREGDLYDETLIHLYLQTWGLKLGILNEWFLDRNWTLQRFHDRKDKMLKRVWRYRQELFSVQDFKKGGNELKKRIYEDLRMVMWEEKKSKEIDKQWRQIIGKDKLKKMREDHYGSSRICGICEL